MSKDERMAISVIKQAGPFGAVVLLHLAFFHALQSGLLREAAQLLPKEVSILFITREQPVPAPPPPIPIPQPKIVPLAKQAPALQQPAPLAPAAAALDTPSPTAIAVAPAPQPAESVSAPVAAPAAVPAAPLPPKTIASGAEYIQQPKPRYPPQSKRIGETGKVTLRVLVSDTGHPQRAEVHESSGSTRLDEAARQAVMLALFKPHMEEGKAIAVYVLVPVDFQLNG